MSGEIPSGPFCYLRVPRGPVARKSFGLGANGLPRTTSDLVLSSRITLLGPAPRVEPRLKLGGQLVGAGHLLLDLDGHMQQADGSNPLMGHSDFLSDSNIRTTLGAEALDSLVSGRPLSRNLSPRSNAESRQTPRSFQLNLSKVLAADFSGRLSTKPEAFSDCCPRTGLQCGPGR